MLVSHIKVAHWVTFASLPAHTHRQDPALLYNSCQGGVGKTLLQHLPQRQQLQMVWVSQLGPGPGCQQPQGLCASQMGKLRI